MKTLTLKENRDQIYRTGPVQLRTLLTFEDEFCQKNMEAYGRSHFIFQLIYALCFIIYLPQIYFFSFRMFLQHCNKL